MSLEIEVKILEIDRPQIMARLEQLGGKLMGDWLLYTYIYDFPDRRLLAKGSYLRLRNEGDVWHCTYKRPPRNAPAAMAAKVREELELVVGDVAVAREILAELGLEVTLYFEKKRLHYVYDQLVFDIDELPHLPPYLEIEAPSSAEIDRGLSLLGLAADKALPWGPRELLAHYGIQMNQITELKF